MPTPDDYDIMGDLKDALEEALGTRIMEAPAGVPDLTAEDLMGAWSGTDARFEKLPETVPRPSLSHWPMELYRRKEDGTVWALYAVTPWEPSPCMLAERWERPEYLGWTYWDPQPGCDAIYVQDETAWRDLN